MVGAVKKRARLTRLELEVMNVLWNSPCPIREIQESWPSRRRPAYTTIQTVVYRLEAKGMVRRIKKVGNAHVFEATASRDMAHGRLIDELLSLFGGRAQPVVAHLIDTGKLTLDDLKQAEQTLRALARKPEQDK
jgi:BlaI family transcriptional regulator, penicillinase repressor